MKLKPLLILMTAISCGGAPQHGEHSHSSSQGKAGAESQASGASREIPAAEKQAYQRAKPVFERYCAKCHGPDGKSKARGHFTMDSYPFGGHHADEIGKRIMRSLGEGGKPSMPLGNPGAVTGDELEAIRAWAQAFAASR